MCEKYVTSDTNVTTKPKTKAKHLEVSRSFCKFATKISAMSNMNSSYRPHDPGHDYYAPGIYLITLVVRNRDRNHELLGRLNGDVKAPAVVLTEIGKAVEEEWEKTPVIQQARGNDLTLVAQVCMPDHWHGVVQVNKPMNKSLGHIIQYVKSSCTARWRKITGSVLDSSSSQAIRGMSEQQRQLYYSSLPLEQQPLWDDDYDDTICLTDANGNPDARHFSAMIRYVEDNPRRAVIRRARPEFMRRCLHVVIGGRDYAAFGNLFLLRWARKVQVFCHRKAPDGRTPYEQTDAYRRECAEWKRMVMQGATAIVTPGISMGERIIKDRCIERGYPLIHLQKEAIGSYWKPELKRFEACANGALLILAPWKPETIGEVNGVPSETDYSIFHNLNHLAEEICAFEGEARVVG